MKYKIEFSTKHPYYPPGPSRGPDPDLEGTFSLCIEASSDKLAEVLAQVLASSLYRPLGALRQTYKVVNEDDRVVAASEESRSDHERIAANLALTYGY